MKFLPILAVLVIARDAFAFTTGPLNTANNLNSHLSAYSTKEVTALTEKSPCLPFLLRPQDCKGYVGDVGFDPFYFSREWSMEYLREAELKHGRVCMLAWTGWVAVDLGMRVYPVPEGWASLNSLHSHEALFSSSTPNADLWSTPLAYILYALAVPEIFQFKRVNEMLTEGQTSRAAGDMSWDFLGYLTGQSDEYVDQMKLKELKHARLGMLAFLGVVVQSAVIGAESFPYITVSSPL